MTDSKVVIRSIRGREVNFLNAEKEAVKFNKTGVFICEQGEATLTIDNVEYTMTPQSMVVYFSYSSLHILHHSDDLRGVLIGADLEMLQPLLFKVTNFNAIFIIKQYPLQQLSVRQITTLRKYLDLYINAVDKARIDKAKGATKANVALSEMAEMQIEMLTNCIILEIIECYADLDVEPTHQSRRDEVLQTFVAMLYRKYRNEHEVAFYAKELCLTSRYFSAIVKERSGKSPSTWISTALLVDAKHQLKNTNLSIKEVSDLLNFPTQSYFGKWFKNLTGVSPLDFRYGGEPNIKIDKDFTEVIERGIAHIRQ